MTFWDHIDELRKTLVLPLIVLAVVTAVAFMLKDQLFAIVLAANSPDFVTYGVMPGAETAADAPAQLVRLVSTELTAQFMMHMKVSFYVGLMLTIPFFFYKLFRYASPGLYRKERRYSARILVFSFIAFLVGVVVNYFVIFPFSLRFLAAYSVSPQVGNMITLDSYVGMLMTLSLLMGLCFELPVMSWLLSRLGILKAAMLRKYRRHAVIAILVVSAVITPTTDIFTLLLVSMPILLLYELSILIARVTERRLRVGATVAVAE